MAPRRARERGHRRRTAQRATGRRGVRRADDGDSRRRASPGQSARLRPVGGERERRRERGDRQRAERPGHAPPDVPERIHHQPYEDGGPVAVPGAGEAYDWHARVLFAPGGWQRSRRIGAAPRWIRITVTLLT